MDNVQLLNALKNLIVANKDTLVQDLRHQGVNRQIRQVTTSTLTPPREFYTMLITISRTTEMEQVDAVNTPANMNAYLPIKRHVMYDVELTVGDEAVMQLSQDDEPFESMDQDFQKLVNPIAKLILDSDVDGTFKLSDNREIVQLNESYTWNEAEMFHAMLYAQLRFTIVEECDTRNLYD